MSMPRNPDERAQRADLALRGLAARRRLEAAGLGAMPLTTRRRLQEEVARTRQGAAPGMVVPESAPGGLPWWERWRRAVGWVLLGGAAAAVALVVVSRPFRSEQRWARADAAKQEVIESAEPLDLAFPGDSLAPSAAPAALAAAPTVASGSAAEGKGALARDGGEGDRMATALSRSMPE